MSPVSAACPVADGMPMLGLGTWQNDDPQQCAESVRTALETGYRHIDTAQAYGNEEAVGDGIAAADVPREEVFLATKIHRPHLDYDDVLSKAEECLTELGVDYVDLLYVHWPSHAYDPEETLPAFAELEDRGDVERIGVSNFEPEHVERAAEVLGEYPFANQVELHPLLQQEHLRECAADRGVELVAYSPLARGAVLDHPVVASVAEKHGVSAARVCLAWLREVGVTAIPKATSESHVRDNWRSLDLELDDDDLERIDAIDETERQIHPDFGPDAWG